MALVATQSVSMIHRLAVVELVRRAMRRAASRRRLTAQERANLNASWTPPPIFTASLGGHPRPATRWTFARKG